MTLKITSQDFNQLGSKKEKSIPFPETAIDAINVTVDNARLYITLGNHEIYANPSLMDGYVELDFETPIAYTGAMKGKQTQYNYMSANHEFAFEPITEITNISVTVDNGRFYLSINGIVLDVIAMTDGQLEIG